MNDYFIGKHRYHFTVKSSEPNTERHGLALFNSAKEAEESIRADFILRHNHVCSHLTITLVTL